MPQPLAHGIKSSSVTPALRSTPESISGRPIAQSALWCMMFGMRIRRSSLRARLLVFSLLLFALSCVPVPVAQGQSARHLGKQKKHVRKTAQVLVASYDTQTGLFRGTGWWNSANGITALAHVSRDLPTHEFDTVFTNTFTAAQRRFPGFLNEFYDDEGWWALAWMDVYELGKDDRFLAMSKSIFLDMAGGWSDTCGGGIWWKKNERYKNAIANELFLSVAVRLASLSASKEDKAMYLDWAQREGRWFLSSGMINSESLVNDGLDANCQNNHRTTWSYNQGVILAGLAGLSQLTGDTTLLQQANQIAAAVKLRLTDSNGVVHDPCEPNCGPDGIQFKGILLRNLVTLEKASPSDVVSQLIQANADSVWTHARTKAGSFSVNWAGPPQDSGTGSLISALDALTAEVSIGEQTAP